MNDQWIAQAVLDLVGLIGIMFGYWVIDKDLQSVVLGYLIFTVLSYIFAVFILGVALV